MGKKTCKNGDEWQEAKRRCRLSEEEVRMAKELGFKPCSLIKNIPAKSQTWKAPVSEWIRDLHVKRFGDIRKPGPARNQRKSPAPLAKATGENLGGEGLLPQYDANTGDIYYTRAGDGEILTLEEAGRCLEELDVARISGAEEEFPGLNGEDLRDDFEPSEDEIEDEDQHMLRRQKQFRMAAEAVAVAMGQRPEVEKIALFGSVAKPLETEVPRFSRCRRAQIEVSHECKDVDLAVWVSRLDCLKALQKARSQALTDLMAGHNVGVAHHQVDVFLLEPGTDRYLGRLCRFGQCPKGKKECRVTGCGATPFLQRHEGFAFDWLKASGDSIDLYVRKGECPGKLTGTDRTERREPFAFLPVPGVPGCRGAEQLAGKGADADIRPVGKCQGLRLRWLNRTPAGTLTR